MKLEIERKFLVDTKELSSAKLGNLFRIRQGYFSMSSSSKVTARARTMNDKGFFCIKSLHEPGSIMRKEFEYEIPLKDAADMIISLCDTSITKDRYIVEGPDSKEWFVDIFHGMNTWLALAEVELDSEHQEIVLPSWVSKEVTDDPRYLSVNLAASPYSTWKTVHEEQ